MAKPCRMRVLPLPLGEVPEAERVIFALSVGFAASSPRVGAKRKRIVTRGNPRRGPRQCALAPNDTQFFGLGGCESPEYPTKLETFQRSAQNGIPWIVEKAENHFLRQKGLDFLRKLL